MMTEPNINKIFLNLDVEKALASYLDAKGLNIKSKKKYLEFYHKFSNTHEELNQQTMDKFLKYNNNSPCRAMVKHLLKAILRWDFPQETKVYVSQLDIPKYSKKKARKEPLHLDYKELDYLISHMSGTDILSIRNKLSIQTQWWGGLRLSELIGLNYASLETSKYDKSKEFQSIKIRSETAKQGKEAYAWIPTKIYKNIVLYLKARSKLSSNFARRISEGENIWGFKKTSYSRLLNNQTIKILGRAYNTHSLRHGRSVDLIRKGVPIDKVKEILRHSDISSTMIYVHTSKEEIENSLR